MSTKNITFDPDSGVAYAVNLVINTGADFKANFNVNTVSNSAFNFTGWTGTSRMTKSVSIGSSAYPVATFNVGFTSAVGGKFNISLGSTATRTLNEGRYVYDILVSSASTVYRIINGNILVIPGISSAP
jgi:hypothetical protein